MTSTFMLRKPAACESLAAIPAVEHMICHPPHSGPRSSRHHAPIAQRPRGSTKKVDVTWMSPFRSNSKSTSIAESGEAPS
jgi:hypothetical protein